CVRKRACAARLTLPVRATSMKDSRWVRSIDSGISAKFIARIRTSNWTDGSLGMKDAPTSTECSATGGPDAPATGVTRDQARGAHRRRTRARRAAQEADGVRLPR